VAAIAVQMGVARVPRAVALLHAIEVPVPITVPARTVDRVLSADPVRKAALGQKDKAGIADRGRMALPKAIVARGATVAAAAGAVAGKAVVTVLRAEDRPLNPLRREEDRGLDGRGGRAAGGLLG
jgi:hypothetical protein